MNLGRLDILYWIMGTANSCCHLSSSTTAHEPIPNYNNEIEKQLRIEQQIIQTSAGILVVYGYVKEQEKLLNLSTVVPNSIILIINEYQFYWFKHIELYSIGENGEGQQGNGGNEDIKKITKIKTFKKKIKNMVTCGGWYSRHVRVAAYILFDDGTYECCGSNKDGVLGIGHFNNINIWHQVKDMKIKNIFTAPNGSSRSFCISNDNKIYAVGLNNYNSFGIETNEEKNNKWIPIDTSFAIQKVATSQGYTTFLSKSGKIYVAGYDDGSGGLGLGKDIKSSPTIQEIEIKIKFKDIYCGYAHTLALDNNYGVWSWGEGEYGELGHGDNNNRYVPTRIEYFIKNNIKIGKICCGVAHNILLSLTQKIYCFGVNYSYQCGNGSNEDAYLPQPNETLKKEKIIDIKCGGYHNIIKTADNKYYLWGDNNYNQCLSVSTKYITKPLLFHSNYFDKDQEIIDIYPGCYETRIIIGTKTDQDEKENL